MRRSPTRAGEVMTQNKHDRSHDAGRWRTVRHALGSWSRTVRLCLIILAMSIPTELTVLTTLHR